MPPTEPPAAAITIITCLVIGEEAWRHLVLVGGTSVAVLCRFLRIVHLWLCCVSCADLFWSLRGATWAPKCVSTLRPRERLLIDLSLVLKRAGVARLRALLRYSALARLKSDTGSCNSTGSDLSREAGHLVKFGLKNDARR